MCWNIVYDHTVCRSAYLTNSAYDPNFKTRLMFSVLMLSFLQFVYTIKTKQNSRRRKKEICIEFVFY